MLEQPTRNLLSFIAEEHACELVSTFKHHEHLSMFTAVDSLFQAPIPHFDVEHGLGTVSQLYLFVQYYMYAAMSNVMRLHQSEAYSCTRIAIDATLTAYRIIENQDLHPLYQQRDHTFQIIARFMKKATKADHTKFPLAKDLLAAWDICSEFGSHADVSTFFYRMKTIPDIDDSSKQMLQFMFFQQPENDELASLHYSELLHTFMCILAVFDPFVRTSTPGFDHATWTQKRNDFSEAVVRQWQIDMNAARAKG